MKYQNKLLFYLAIFTFLFLNLNKTTIQATVTTPPLANGIISNATDLKAAMTHANPGDTLYVTDMKITGELTFEPPTVEAIDVILASPNGNLVTLDVSAMEYPDFALNFIGTSTVKLSFQNVRLDGGSTGSGIRFSKDGGTLVLNGADLKNCHAAANGGAVHVEFGNAVLTDCSLTNNETEGNGGGVFLGSGDLHASNCTFTGNKAKYNGGGAYVLKTSGHKGNGEAIVINCRFDENYASSFGGGILTAGNLEIRDSIIHSNSASLGGGIYSESEGIVIENSQITGNKANIDYDIAKLYEEYGFLTGGGGILSMTSNISVVNSNIRNNETLQHGGGICSSGGDVTVYNSRISGNKAGRDGGGVWISNLFRLFTRNVEFSENRAASEYKWTLDYGDEAEIHRANILYSTFTTPFTNAFNNFDVNFYREVSTTPTEPESETTPQPTAPSEEGGLPQPTVPSGEGETPQASPGVTSPTTPTPSPPASDSQELPNGDDAGVVDGNDDMNGESPIPDEEESEDEALEGELEMDVTNRSIPWPYPFILGFLLGTIFYLFLLLFMKHYVTRGEFVDMVVHAIPLEDVKDGEVGYEDVPEDSDYHSSIQKAEAANLLIRFTGHKFHPNAPITREEMAGVFAEWIRRKNPTVKVEEIDLEKRFKDYKDINNRFLDDVKLVCNYHMMSDASDEAFDPQGFRTKRKVKAMCNNLIHTLGVNDKSQRNL